MTGQERLFGWFMRVMVRVAASIAPPGADLVAVWRHADEVRIGCAIGPHHARALLALVLAILDEEVRDEAADAPEGPGDGQGHLFARFAYSRLYQPVLFGCRAGNDA